MALPPGVPRARAYVAIASRVTLSTVVEPSSAQQTAAETLEQFAVTGPRSSSIPLALPPTVERITRRQIDETDAKDVLKCSSSLFVRKRYIGDYDHAVLGSRASGTGNGARSLVYADGILLSNLLGNSAGFTPHWGLVMPEEIERVDVLYSPFSAAYPGNSVVDFATRMPTEIEAHAKRDFFNQHFRERASDGRYGGGEGSFAFGSRSNGDAPTGPSAQFKGNTDLTSLWARGAGRLAPDWKAIVGNVITDDDPNLNPERSWTSEPTAERVVDIHWVGFTYFNARSHDALHAQTNVDVEPNVTNVQSVDLIRTNGFEVAADANSHSRQRPWVPATAADSTARSTTATPTDSPTPASRASSSSTRASAIASTGTGPARSASTTSATRSTGRSTRTRNGPTLRNSATTFDTDFINFLEHA
ncbi:MAG: TonB-dependent receptor plug domain-containing protein [Burkholderiaceae bacterium]